MATFLLDTDTLSLYQHRHPLLLQAIDDHSTDVIALSTITLEEQISGWSKLARSARTPREVENAASFLRGKVLSWRDFSIVAFHQDAILRFEQMLRSRLNVGGNDLRIAALALEIGATVVTRNRRDFGRVLGLTIEDWSA